MAKPLGFHCLYNGCLTTPIYVAEINFRQHTSDFVEVLPGDERFQLDYCCGEHKEHWEDLGFIFHPLATEATSG